MISGIDICGILPLWNSKILILFTIFLNILLVYRKLRDCALVRSPKAWLSKGCYRMEALRIRIPERYQAGIAKLIPLPDNALEELLSVLNEMPHSLNLESIKAYAISKISLIPENDVNDIISALDSLYYIKNESGVPVHDFTEQVLQAMAETENKALHISASQREPFQGRLIRLMNGTLLSVAAKSREILYEQERTFGSARVLSDIRPILNENAENNTDAAIIIHTLKINYIQNNQHKEFFVALDTEDVSFMIDTLIRAQEKEETLKSILVAANVPYMDAE